MDIMDLHERGIVQLGVIAAKLVAILVAAQMMWISAW